MAEFRFKASEYHIRDVILGCALSVKHESRLNCKGTSVKKKQHYGLKIIY